MAVTLQYCTVDAAAPLPSILSVDLSAVMKVLALPNPVAPAATAGMLVSSGAMGGGVVASQQDKELRRRFALPL